MQIGECVAYDGFFLLLYERSGFYVWHIVWWKCIEKSSDEKRINNENNTTNAAAAA